MSIGKHIRRLRTDRGWTQRDLARAADLTEVQVCKMENDRHEPTITTLRRVASALDCGVAELLDEASATKDPSTPLAAGAR
jgi:putative transcriptional regulator